MKAESGRPDTDRGDKLVKGDGDYLQGISRRRFIGQGLAAAGAAVALSSGQSHAAEMVPGQDGKVLGYKDTPKLPWAPEYHKHDPDRPWPRDVEPGPLCCPEGAAAKAPSDAIVLFDGEGTGRFRGDDWIVENGELVAHRRNLVTRDSFGDCQLHLEWQAPDPPRGRNTDRGNSGVFFMERYEIQIFDSHTEKIYPDGIAGAVYGETPPLVHPIRPPGEWNVYDIIFIAPVFSGAELARPAMVTLLFNGLLAQHATVIHGPTAWRRIDPYRAHAARAPLMLQHHGNPVRFRNIWLRDLSAG